MHQEPLQTGRFMKPTMSATSVATVLTIADTLAILGSGYLSYDMLIVYAYRQNLYITATLFVWLAAIAFFNYSNLYHFHVALDVVRKFHILAVALATSFLFLLAILYSLQFAEDLSRRWVAWFALGSLLTVFAFRFVLQLLLTKLRVLRRVQRCVAVLGEGKQCEQIVAAMKNGAKNPLDFAGVYAVEPEQARTRKSVAESSVTVGDIDQLANQVRSGQIDDVFVAMPWSEEERIVAAIAKLKELPVNIYLVNDLIGFRLNLRPAPTHFSSLPVVEVVGKPMSGWDAVIKAIEDYVLGIVLLVLLLPVLLVIGILVKIDSAGPVFFKQRRLGFNNQVFQIYKFRTMTQSASTARKMIQAQPDDQRVTRLGKYLRRWSLDELPQILNVMNGTMSIVGPRPHEVDQNAEFSQRTENYFARHRVKPGITGLAQVRGFRGATDTKEKLDGRIRNDNFYAENWSLSLDLWILVRTVGVCLFGRNAY